MYRLQIFYSFTMSALCEKYGITHDSPVITRTYKIWNAFADSIHNN
jgi:hypothetical protein